jgi:ubiquinone/menaquinone biosynthesis C-methylase UbiE
MQDYYKALLRKASGIMEQDGLFYQDTLLRNSDFEQQYTQLRNYEGRLFTNEVVRNLPEISSDHALKNEWRIREQSLSRLIHFLKKTEQKKILEIGCGNGWLIHRIHQQLKSDCCGLDVNETELRQAVNVFGKERGLAFLYADITSDIFTESIADTIIVASAIQYFPDPATLIQKLLKLLNPAGTIHIIDSPFYGQESVVNAKERSKKYFLESGAPEMSDYYFHHPWKSLVPFKYKIEHDPNSFLNKLKRPFNKNSPFPWILIKKEVLILLICCMLFLLPH